MAVLRCEAAPGANLSYQLTDGQGNLVEARVVGSDGNPRPSDFMGGYLQIGRPGLSEGKLFLTPANVADLLPVLQRFATYSSIV